MIDPTEIEQVEQERSDKSILIRSLFMDWLRAPVSGTSVIICILGAGMAIYRGEVEIGLLWLANGQLIMMKRPS